MYIKCNDTPMILAINYSLQSFASPPNYMFVGIPCFTSNPDFEVTDYVFASNGINILTFTVRLNKKTKIVEFKIDSTAQKYTASGLDDKIKICDFVSHLLVLETELIKIYKVLTKKLKVILSSNSITTYYLYNNLQSKTGTIKIKNGLIIFEYNELTKYTYTTIETLLANPLIKQFKRSKFWF